MRVPAPNSTLAPTPTYDCDPGRLWGHPDPLTLPSHFGVTDPPPQKSAPGWGNSAENDGRFCALGWGQCRSDESSTSQNEPNTASMATRRSQTTHDNGKQRTRLQRDAFRFLFLGGLVALDDVLAASPAMQANMSCQLHDVAFVDDRGRHGNRNVLELGPERDRRHE